MERRRVLVRTIAIGAMAVVVFWKPAAARTDANCYYANHPSAFPKFAISECFETDEDGAAAARAWCDDKLLEFDEEEAVDCVGTSGFCTDMGEPPVLDSMRCYFGDKPGEG